ncbi:unnamed protein product [Amoebophrya sp. A25]|nr:unnamed protein product [Amoebophrya sp. A25]|eukprot:GSA25T00025718001.1
MASTSPRCDTKQRSLIKPTTRATYLRVGIFALMSIASLTCQCQASYKQRLNSLFGDIAEQLRTVEKNVEEAARAMAETRMSAKVAEHELQNSVIVSDTDSLYDIWDTSRQRTLGYLASLEGSKGEPSTRGWWTREDSDSLQGTTDWEEIANTADGAFKNWWQTREEENMEQGGEEEERANVSPLRRPESDTGGADREGKNVMREEHIAPPKQQWQGAKDGVAPSDQQEPSTTLEMKHHRIRDARYHDGARERLSRDTGHVEDM